MKGTRPLDNDEIPASFNMFHRHIRHTQTRAVHARRFHWGTHQRTVDAVSQKKEHQITQLAAPSCRCAVRSKEREH